MKQNIKSYSIIIFTLLLFALFTSLILTFLETKQILNYNTSFIITTSISYVLLAILSYILGRRVKKNGLIHGLLFSLLMIGITSLFGNSLSGITTIIKIVTKTIIILFFTILGVNKK